MTCRPSVFAWTTILLSPFVLSGCGARDDAASDGLPAGAFAMLELEQAYPHEFSFLNGVRQLADGTLLAADPLSQVLLHVDISAGAADTLARIGEGPGEYQQPDNVFPLPGDSTLLVDIGKARLISIGPDMVLHDGMQIAKTVEREGRVSMQLIMPRFVDGEGRLYYPGQGGLDQGPPDSTAILRYDRAAERVDTLGWAWRPEPNVIRSGSSVRMLSRQMEGRDDWAVGSDGRLAIVRAADYSVEWRYPDGRVVEGPPNPVESRRISDEDKEAYLENRSSGGLMMMMSASGSGAVEMSMSRGGGARLGDAPGLLDFEWAEAFPPFQPDRALVSPWGALWVERWLPTGENPQLDVFDEDGVKLGTVALPAGRRLIGFGSTARGEPALYLVRTDEFDLRWLERYRVVM